jgi:hypothetical protein
MALAHVKFGDPTNYGYRVYLLREDDGPVVGINVQIRQHRWHYIWPWREYRSWL